MFCTSSDAFAHASTQLSNNRITETEDVLQEIIGFRKTYLYDFGDIYTKFCT